MNIRKKSSHPVSYLGNPQTIQHFLFFSTDSKAVISTCRPFPSFVFVEKITGTNEG